MSAQIDYPVFDADNHYYETRDAFSRHIAPSLRDKAIHTRIDDDGVERVYVGDKRFTFLERHFVQFRAEMFNAFNKVNYNNPGGTLNTAAFGVVTSARDARQVQFGLKYGF